MEKKQKISVNPSTGAEKVENIEKELQEEKREIEQKQAKKAVAVAKKPKKSEKKEKNKQQIEQKRAKARIERAKQKKLSKEERQKKAEEKRKLLKAKREERRAKIAAARRARALRNKELLEKRKALRAEKAQKRQQEKEARRAKAAEKRQKNQSKKKRAPKRKRHEHQRAAGFGGWLAAVISLGVVTLALGSIVTVGAIDMSKTKQSMMMGYKGTLYEFAGVMDNVDDDLDKARIAATPTQQGRILTDLLVQARLAEASLEKFPVEAEAEANLTSFINRTARFAEEMLAKLSRGERLNERDEAKLAYLYKVSHAVREQLDKTVAELSDDDMLDFIKDKAESGIKGSLKSIEDMTLPENKPIPLVETGASGSVETKKKDKPAVSREQAEALCQRYFKGYEISKVEYLGETLSRSVEAYDFRLTDNMERELYVQIDKNSGALVEFDFYEDCKEKNYDQAACEEVAVSFLNRLGYEGMIAVYGKESGATVDFTFVYQTGGVTYYPDEVKVKVCMQKGVVIGLEASKFLKNHHSREAFSWNLTLAEAEEKLHSGLEILSTQRVVIDAGKREKAAYEFFAQYQKDRYLIYIDAKTGEEISIVNVKNLMV